MDVNNYPSNSDVEKDKKVLDNDKHLTKVTSGTVKRKKKSGLSKFSNALISEDASNVKSYILMDVLIPAIKKAVSDIITNGIEMLLYGETGKRDRKRSRADRVSYRDYYDDRDDRDRRSRSRVRATYEYDDIVVDTRGEAERVIENLQDALEDYGSVCVGDLYDLVGITGTFTDFKYGWTDLRPARAERVRDGYLIRMPKAVPLTD